MATKLLALLTLTVLVAAPTAVRADEIYGQVWLERVGRPASGARLSAFCGNPSDKETASATADRYGGYRLLPVPRSAACRIEIDHPGLEAGSIRIRVLDTHTKADFQLERGTKTWRIRRR